MNWLKKNGFGLVAAILIIYVLSLFYEEEPEQASYQNSANLPPANTVIQNVTKTEDGNSVFSADLLPKMTKEEIAHYSQIFYWAMDHLDSGKSHEWNFYNTHGIITPLSRFKNNLGHKCRRFKEVLKVHEIQQRITGISCQKVGGGWCKLRPNSTPACSLGRKPGIGSWFDDAQRGIQNLFR